MCAPVPYKKQVECTIAKCLRTMDIKVREWIWILAPVLTRMWPYVTKLLCRYFLIYKMEIIRGVLWRLNESMFEKSSALCKICGYHHHHCDPHHNHHFTGRDTEKTWGRISGNGPHRAWMGELPGFSRVLAGGLVLRRWPSFLSCRKGVKDPLEVPGVRCD